MESNTKITVENYNDAMMLLGFVFNESTSEEQLQKCAQLSNDIWHMIISCPVKFFQFAKVCLPFKRCLDSQLYDEMEEALVRFTIETIKGGVVGSIRIAEILLKNDKEMFEKAILKCRKSYFGYHPHIDTTINGERRKRYCYGITRSECPEVFDEIIKLRPECKLSSMQYVSKEDVMDATYDPVSVTAKAYRGFQISTIYRRNESYIEWLFEGDTGRIKESNIRGHKSPDWILYSKIDGRPLMTVEVRSVSGDDFLSNIKTALEHGDEKEMGWNWYAKEYDLDESVLKSAAMVTDATFSKMTSLSNRQIVELVRTNKIEITMDCLIIILREIGIGMRAILMPLSDRCTEDFLDELLDSSWAILVEPEYE